MLMQLAGHIEGGAINNFVLTYAWLWPTLECIHFIGLSLLLGSLIVADLRLAGFFRSIDLAATHKLIPWAIAGFVLNLISGVLFYFGDPFRYTANFGFRIKMLLVLVAGMNALWYWWKIHPAVHDLPADADTPLDARVVAVISLVAWTGVLLLGRLIPYVSTG